MHREYNTMEKLGAILSGRHVAQAEWAPPRTVLTPAQAREKARARARNKQARKSRKINRRRGGRRRG